MMGSREYSSYTCKQLWGWARIIFPASRDVDVRSIICDINTPKI